MKIENIHISINQTFTALLIYSESDYIKLDRIAFLVTDSFPVVEKNLVVARKLLDSCQRVARKLQESFKKVARKLPENCQKVVRKS